ncbi:NAD(P)H-hydrate dehydratase [Oryzomonas rubra]|uniref:Bifunctional NAD(P)H-hydrate repair enzyme n=1 Tax=Oryzomonas rubra TaxID=2509454 RepID=A0A5A9XTI1_9BACT|nr:NAD(P)H-hydrate dehydratase [Oryzomonas rubra]KAA0895389.1 NAD(P)H-hydrate dehydratase [Oryzomonas rubra]
MKVIAAQTMQELDRQAIQEHGIPGLELMEHAGHACMEAIFHEFGYSGGKRAFIFAGRGNNGGDGYVIARLLLQSGWQVRVCILAERDRICGDAAINLEQLPPAAVSYCTVPGQLAGQFQEELSQADVIVDALFGTGLNSEVVGIHQEAVELINAAGCPILAVDIPSGIHGTSGRVLGCAVRATVTVTFAAAKLGHVLYPGADHTGRLVVADIGIPAELVENASGCEFLTAESIALLLRRRDRQAHKGHFGHSLIVAGSRGKTGAAALSANSAVRAGSGLVTLAVPESLNPILEVKTTEAMTVPLADSGSGYLTDSAFPAIEGLLPGKDALAIGPGLGLHPATVALVRALLKTADLPLVIDADGLNAVAQDANCLLDKKSTHVVLTPHPGEMARLMGATIADVENDRIATARKFAAAFGVHLILKGSRTIIVAPDGSTAINGSGNPGMASGGMGDVLTGIIVSLLGQGYNCHDACRLGVFIHGYAADLVAQDKGEIGMNAGDVLEKLPYAYHNLLPLPKENSVCRP